MAKSIPIVDTDEDTFLAWIIKTNTIVDLCNTEVVTANNDANGATTTGNGFVIGVFGANTVVATTIRGGNTIANGVLTISSNTNFTDSVYRFTPGVTLGANSIVHEHGLRVSISNTDLQNADTFASASFRSAKYVISVTDPVNSNYQVTEILLLHNGSATFSTEYATIVSNTNLATFSSDVSSGNVRLRLSPAVANLQINIARTLVSA